MGREMCFIHHIRHFDSSLLSSSTTADRLIVMAAMAAMTTVDLQFSSRRQSGPAAAVAAGVADEWYCRCILRWLGPRNILGVTTNRN